MSKQLPDLHFVREIKEEFAEALGLGLISATELIELKKIVERDPHLRTKRFWQVKIGQWTRQAKKNLEKLSLEEKEELTEKFLAQHRIKGREYATIPADTEAVVVLSTTESLAEVRKELDHWLQEAPAQIGKELTVLDYLLEETTAFVTENELTLNDLSQATNIVIKIMRTRREAINLPWGRLLPQKTEIKEEKHQHIHLSSFGS